MELDDRHVSHVAFDGSDRMVGETVVGPPIPSLPFLPFLGPFNKFTFGITKSTSADEDKENKARLARFVSAASADPQEEQKKKARAPDRCSDKSKITRKQSKASKHGHENQKSTMLKFQSPKP
ncbi:hypothetical protein Tco_0033611 [Tanacetum coccineum]